MDPSHFRHGIGVVISKPTALKGAQIKALKSLLIMHEITLVDLSS